LHWLPQKDVDVSCSALLTRRHDTSQTFIKEGRDILQAKIVHWIIQSGAEKRENLKLTMRFRPAVKFLLHVSS
jgi:hypothetical protein